ncbi:MAG: hypothetical protein SFV51_10515 [Bryobacteraceae bacterium]|nr:hypothetical protein [Bryobacteraceae bacterium]
MMMPLFLLIPAAFAQPAPADRVFRFAHTEAPQQLQEIATVVRSIAEVKDLAVNPAAKTLTVRADALQMGIVEWLLDELDRPVSPQAAPASREYRTASAAGERVRILYFTAGRTPQDLQEAATMVRSLGEIPRLFTYSAAKAIVVRGAAPQVALAAWLVQELNEPGRKAASGDHLLGSGDAARVFYLANTPSVQDLQEVAVLVRSISGIRRLFTYNSGRALAIRGTPEELALAGWLVRELDQPAVPQGTREYKMPAEDDRVRVFYLRGAATPQKLQETATEVRSATGVRRLFTYNRVKAMALRGTAEQLAKAERMVGGR